MARIGVLTFHRASNYGAVLQAYALQATLNDWGHDAKVVDYRSEFIEAHYTPSPLKTLTSPRRLGIALLRNGYMRDRRRLFRDFVVSRIALTRPAQSRDLADLARKFDILMAGSDQVWNPQTAGFDENYFLAFAPEGVSRVAYAASIGVAQLPDHLVPEFQRLLSGYDQITMREATGSVALEGVLGYRPENVLDPTLLLSREQWEAACGAPERDSSEPYVLLYLLAEEKGIVDYARRLAREMGAEVRYVSQRLFRLRGVRTVDNAGPEEFVRLFLGASAIVTNSFHGVAFAVNFGLNLHFDLLPPPSGVNSRITDFVSMLGVGDRRIGQDLLQPHSAASKASTADLLSAERARSLDLLSRMVKK